MSAPPSVLRCLAVRSARDGWAAAARAVMNAGVVPYPLAGDMPPAQRVAVRSAAHALTALHAAVRASMTAPDRSSQEVALVARVLAAYPASAPACKKGDR